MPQRGGGISEPVPAPYPSVTQGDFFQGELGWIFENTRTHISLPVSRRTYVYDPFQVYETRAAEPARFFFIVRLLGAGGIEGLPSRLRGARNLGIEQYITDTRRYTNKKQTERL